MPAQAPAARPGRTGRWGPHPSRAPERLAQGGSDSQQPAAQGRVFGVVPKNPIDHFAIEKIPTLFAKNFEIRPAQAGRRAARRSSSRARPGSRRPQGRRRRPSQPPVDRQIDLWTAGFWTPPRSQFALPIDFDSSCDRFSPRTHRPAYWFAWPGARPGAESDAPVSQNVGHRSASMV